MKYRVLFTREQILARVSAIARQICCDYAGRDLVFICLLRGSFIFAADLIRAVETLNATLPLEGRILSVEIDFRVVASYGDKQKSSGVVEVRHEVEGRFVLGRDVIVVEDVMETERTLLATVESLRIMRPETLQLCVLIRKDVKQRRLLEARYIGFDGVQGFLKGYGMDAAQKDRGLPDIWVQTELPSEKF